MITIGTSHQSVVSPICQIHVDLIDNCGNERVALPAAEPHYMIVNAESSFAISDGVGNDHLDIFFIGRDGGVVHNAGTGWKSVFGRAKGH